MGNYSDRLESYKKLIQADFPELGIKSFAFIGSGWDHDAIEVNGRLIFRLPKDLEDSEAEPARVSYEVKVLKYLRDKLSIEIPQPMYISPSNSYFGYPKLDGLMIGENRAILAGLDRSALLGDWVRVSSQIHSAMSIEVARLLGVPEYQPEFSLAQRFCRLPKVDRALREHTVKVLADTELFMKQSQALVFAHNDLRFQNILLDSDATKIKGLIDWSDMSIAPIEKEFSSSSWSDAELVRAIAIYPKSTIKTINIAQTLRWRWIEDVSDFIELTDTDSNGAKEILERLESDVTKRVW